MTDYTPFIFVFGLFMGVIIGGIAVVKRMADIKLDIFLDAMVLIVVLYLIKYWFGISLLHYILT